MRALYINPDPSTQTRATTLGCGWMPTVPPEFAAVATAPCVILQGAGQTVVISDAPPTTKAAVTSASAPILAAEATAAAADAARTANSADIITKVQTAIATNITALALPDPTPANNTYLSSPTLVTSATAAQVQAYLRLVDAQVRKLTTQNNALRDQVTALTKQATALERYIGDQLDSTSGT